MSEIPSREQIRDVIEAQNRRIFELEELVKSKEVESKSPAPVTLLDSKIEGVTMPKFQGKPHESVDQYFFSAKMFLTCKNIDYTNMDAMNQRRIVAILASNLRDGAASWFHSMSIEGRHMQTMKELYEAMKDEFVPRDQEHRAREDLLSLKQHGSLDDYVSKFRRALSKVYNMHELDKVHHFTNGLKDKTKKQVRYLRCERLTDAIAAAQSFDRAYFQNHSQIRSRNDKCNKGVSGNSRNWGQVTEAMDISYTKQISKQECVNKKLCFYCKKPGHSIGNCQKRKTKNNGTTRRIQSSSTQNINQYDMRQYAAPQKSNNSESYQVQEINTVCFNVTMEQPTLDIHNVSGQFPLFKKDGYIFGKKVRVMIDSGADHNIIKSGIIPHEIPTTTVTTKARRFDGTIIESATRKVIAPMKIEGFQFPNNEFTEWNIEHDFDIILGQPWLCRFNPNIDWRNQSITFCKVPVNNLVSIQVAQFKENFKNNDYEEIYVMKISTDSTKSLQPKIQDLIHEYADIFPEALPNELPPKRIIEHEIELKEGAKPKKGQPFRLSKMEQEALDKYVEELIAKNWIAESDSDWLCNIFAVPKKDPKTGKFPSRVEWLKSGNAEIALRWVNDYRHLNSQTVIPKIPLPYINDLFDDMNGCTMFSTIDLASGYHQMRMDDKSKKYTAFRTRNNIYHWNVAPMGLAGMPGTWTRYMHKVFPRKEFPFLVVYLDDLCIFSSSLEEHVKHLRLVFDRLRKEKLYTKPNKCVFGQAQIEFLGHIVSADGLQMDPRKLDAINQWPPPTNAKDVQRFLGLTGYYRKFIKNYATLLRPISDLVKKNNTWKWDNEQQLCFDHIKQILTSSPILQLPDYSREFHVTTDASDSCIGGVLSQLNDKGDDLPICYYSKKLNNHEINWPTHEKELYAIKSALGKWRPYLYGQKFKVFTDNSACKWFLQHEKLSMKMTRWLDFFNLFQFTLHHRPGVTNVVADALSRPPKDNFVAGEESNAKKQELSVSQVVVEIENNKQWSQLLKQCYMKDNELKQIYQELKNNKNVQHKDYVIKSDELIYLKTETNRVVIPWTPSKINQNLKLSIYRHHHDSLIAAHPGINKTFMSIRQWFYWFKMFEDISNYVNSCEACKRSKSATNKMKGKLINIPIPEYCWQQITWDLIIFLPNSRDYDAILTIVDRLSKRVRYIPTTSNITSTGIARLLFDEVIRFFGIPEKIISDRDSKFTSEFFKELTRIMGIKLSFTTAHRAQADGQSERQNRTLEDSLRCLVSQHSDTWSDLLSTIEYAHISLPHTSTKISPFEFDTGRKPRNLFRADNDYQVTIQSAGDLVKQKTAIIEQAVKALKEAQDRQKKYFDKKRGDASVQRGDFVFLSTDNLLLHHLKTNELNGDHLNKRKFLPKWIGPFEVIRRMSPSANTYELKLPKTMSKINPIFNIEKLKKDYESPAKFSGRPVFKNLPIILDDDGSPMYVIQALLNKRRFGRRNQYLVQWAGLPNSENSWEYESNIKHVSHWSSLLQELQRKEK